jgi:hypothetical protein
MSLGGMAGWTRGIDTAWESAAVEAVEWWVPRRGDRIAGRRSPRRVRPGVDDRPVQCPEQQADLGQRGGGRSALVQPELHQVVDAFQQDVSFDLRRVTVMGARGQFDGRVDRGVSAHDAGRRGP